MDKKIELQVLNISNSQAQVGAYALVLGEVDGERQLPIIIGPAEAQATALCLKGVKAPRPLTHDLFYTCLNILGTKMLRVLIYKAKEGVFYSYIYLQKRKRLSVSIAVLRMPSHWLCVPTVRSIFMNPSSIESVSVWMMTMNVPQRIRIKKMKPVTLPT